MILYDVISINLVQDLREKNAISSSLGPSLALAVPAALALRASFHGASRRLLRRPVADWFRMWKREK